MGRRGIAPQPPKEPPEKCVKNWPRDGFLDLRPAAATQPPAPYWEPLLEHPALGKAFEETPPAFAGQRGYRGALVKLVLLCRELQRVWGNRPFPL